MGTISMQN